jgi:hypothetical protein
VTLADTGAFVTTDGLTLARAEEVASALRSVLEAAAERVDAAAD